MVRLSYTKKLLLALAVFFVSSLQAEVSVESIRTSAYDYACACDDGHFSAHQRQDKAIASCVTHKLSAESSACEVRGGVWRIGIQGASAQIGVSSPPPPLPVGNDAPVWTDTPSINCTEGVASSIVLVPDFVTDPESDVLTIADGGGTAFPTGVTIDDPNDEIDCGAGTTAGNTTGHTLNATDAAGSNTTVTSAAFPISISAAAGGYEAVLTDMVGYADFHSVTGGEGGNLVTVTNCNNSGAGSLRQALADASGATWIRFTQDTTCTINLGSPLNLISDVTIDGRGSNITIVGPGGSSDSISARRGDQNFILMYLTFDGPTASNNDIISFNNSSSTPTGASDAMERFWLYHVTSIQGEDEAFSVRRSHGQFTVQSCFIKNLTGGARQGILFNNGGSAEAWDDIQMLATFYRTHIQAGTRLPRLSVPMNLHMYNNFTEQLISSNGSIAVDSESGSGAVPQLRFENNISWQAGSKKAVMDYTIGDHDFGEGVATGNLGTNGATFSERNPGSVFTPPYTYSEMVTADTALRDAIIAEAGWQDVVFPGDPP